MRVEGVLPDAYARARAPEPSLDVSSFSAAERILAALAFVGSSAPSSRSRGAGKGSRKFYPRSF